MDGGVTFRAKTSYLEYRLNTTSAFPGAFFRLEFSSTSCKADLLFVTSRDTGHFYRISLEEEKKITFFYKLEDGEFDVSISLAGNRTFCDGEKHSIEFRRYGKTVSSKADNNLENNEEETKVRKIIFSKPDKIVLGGISSNKFDGCMYSAIIQFYWKHGIRNISLNLIKQYLKGDSKVISADLFTGACPETRAEGSNVLKGEVLRAIVSLPTISFYLKHVKCQSIVSLPTYVQHSPPSTTYHPYPSLFEN